MNGKPTIGNIQAIVMMAIAMVFDALKFLLLFLNMLPVVGTAIDVVLSPMISVLEDGIEFVMLWFSGAYKNGGTSSLMLMAATAVAGWVPLVDDFPLTTITVGSTIWQSRRNDKKRFAAEHVARAKNSQQEQLLQQQKAQAAQEAAARAQAQRAAAMKASLAAANDTNAQSSRAA